VGTLISNVHNVFPVITELESAQDNDWYIELKKYFDEFLDLNFADRIINRLVERNDFASLLLWVQKKIKLKVLTNIYKYSRLYETTILEYNPLWNVDGTEERTVNRSKSGNDTDTYNENNITTKTGTDATARTGNDTTTTQKTTFDSASFNDTDKNTLQHNTTDTTSHNTTDNNRHTGTKGNIFENEEEETETVVKQGNIGVTKSTELIDSQRVTVNYSYIEEVVHDIVNTFTYLVD
jgi:hypothetical protein